MQFIIEKNIDGTWGLTPTSGRYEGQIIAKVETASMQGVQFEGRAIVGAIKALWGVTVLCEGVYSDAKTIRALCLGKPFNSFPDRPVTQEHDCFRDGKTNRVLKAAQSVLVRGSEIYAKGGV